MNGLKSPPLRKVPDRVVCEWFVRDCARRSIIQEGDKNGNENSYEEVA